MPDELLECSKCGWTGTEAVRGIDRVNLSDGGYTPRHWLDAFFCPECGANENYINTREVEDEN